MLSQQYQQQLLVIARSSIQHHLEIAQYLDFELEELSEPEAVLEHFFLKAGLIKQRVNSLEVAYLGFQADKNILFIFKQKSNACVASWRCKYRNGLNSRLARAILLVSFWSEKLQAWRYHYTFFGDS